jgi:hypothetical protein
MTRTRRNVNPSFDDPESFVLDVKTGVIRANVGDIGNFLNASGSANSPLKHQAFRRRKSDQARRNLTQDHFSTNWQD